MAHWLPKQITAEISLGRQFYFSSSAEHVSGTHVDCINCWLKIPRYKIDKKIEKTEQS